MRAVKLLLALCTTAAIVTAAHAQGVDWAKVDAAMGRGAAVGGDVHRYGFPRTDLQVTVDGVGIKPGLALGGWTAFKPMGNNMAMVMGDLVLLGNEINPVISKLIDGGLEITAIHNHLLRAEPMTFYMHVGGHGDPVKMATVIHDALATSKTPMTAPAAAAPPAIDLDTAQLDQIMGVKGTNNGGIYGFAVPRRDGITESGMQITPVGPMGAATAINFQPTGGGKAAITGDFVLIGTEVNPVIAAFRANGIEVTAVHSHMLNEQPRLFFMHFWANDDAQKLAKGLRAAIDKTASVTN
jgi:hypothetical protein